LDRITLAPNVTPTQPSPIKGEGFDFITSCPYPLMGRLSHLIVNRLFDEGAKGNPLTPFFLVIPAKAGIHLSAGAEARNGFPPSRE